MRRNGIVSLVACCLILVSLLAFTRAQAPESSAPAVITQAPPIKRSGVEPIPSPYTPPSHPFPTEVVPASRLVPVPERQTVRKTYPVADLIVPTNNAILDGETGQQFRTHEQWLIRKIITLIPASWNEPNGAPNLFFRRGMILVVDQTPEIQKKVADLLEMMSQFQSVEIATQSVLVSCGSAGFDAAVESGFPSKAALDQLTNLDLVSGNGISSAMRQADVEKFLEAIKVDKTLTSSSMPKVTSFSVQRVKTVVHETKFYWTQMAAVAGNMRSLFFTMRLSIEDATLEGSAYLQEGETHVLSTRTPDGRYLFVLTTPIIIINAPWEQDVDIAAPAVVPPPVQMPPASFPAPPPQPITPQ